MPPSRPQPAACEICGTGLCAEAQPDGVPCTGTATVCTSCAKGLTHQARIAEPRPMTEAEEDCLDRAGL